MSFEMLVPHFICPICQSPLITDHKVWRCDGGQNPKNTRHPFDVARQGYVNLLPVNQKKSKTPGDSAESILARQRFLANGHYAPLQTCIADMMRALITQSADSGDNTWLDIGCGEGYYTASMAQAGVGNIIAADISKPAVTEVAKTAKQAGSLWYQRGDNKAAQTAFYPIVTSAAHLPIKAGSITGISSIFSPILPSAFNEVLQDNGHVIIAKPDSEHLASIRAALFDTVREHDSDKFLEELAPYFNLIKTQHIHTELTLDAADLSDLLTMTPYSYRAKPAKRMALLERTKTLPMVTQARFVVYVLQKKSAIKSAPWSQ